MPKGHGPPIRRFEIVREPGDPLGDTIVRRISDGTVLVRVPAGELPGDEFLAVFDLQRRLAVALEDENRRHSGE
ncbi:hypothetical protein [Singulisphaera sp. PoT]|uniref:hypothetical protein n=1 Tax=Singulisphaera sp. PoT TaxID=3411797 RepID=UPI003BF5677B